MQVAEGLTPKLPRTAYDLPAPPPAPKPSAATQLTAESQSTTHDSQDPQLQAPSSPKAKPKAATTQLPLTRPPSQHPKLSPWTAFDFSVDKWEATLNELCVDTTAQQELFLLAQFSPTGAKACNHVLSKVLKKVADGEHVRSWSAFIHVAVKDVRHQLWQAFHEEKQGTWSQ